MIKRYIPIDKSWKIGMAISVLAISAAALTGCTQTGQLTPTAQAVVNTAYNDVCAAMPALGPVSATMNADAKNAYAQAQTICASGSPTNAITAGFDILAVENALLPYFRKATALAPSQGRALSRLPLDYDALVKAGVVSK